MTDTVQKTLSSRICDIVEKISGCSNGRTKRCHMDVLEYFRLKNWLAKRESVRQIDDPVVSDDEITKEVQLSIKLYLADKIPSRRSGISYAIYRTFAIDFPE